MEFAVTSTLICVSSMVIVLPGLMNVGGFRAMPTHPHVLEAITSPRSLCE